VTGDSGNISRGGERKKKTDPKKGKMRNDGKKCSKRCGKEQRKKKSGGEEGGGKSGLGKEGVKKKKNGNTILGVSKKIKS